MRSTTVDGAKAHADLIKFFPDAVSAECAGDGHGWATVTYPDGREAQSRCPGCHYEKMAAKIQRFTPPRFRAPVEIPETVAAWAQRGLKAQGLYLAGQVGTGKTHAAWVALAAWCAATGTIPHGGEAASSDWPAHGRIAPNVIFTRMTDLLDDLRPGDDSRQRIRDCQHAALLVIDDVGAEKPSEWTQERFYSVIDHRYVQQLPLIVTSNLPPAKLAEQVGERAASRLAEMCEVVVMTGTDRRRPAA
jgi:DNA replication protein DnaC